jgi:hypothetical protein
MSNKHDSPRDVVEGGPERAPNGADEPEQAPGRRPHKDEQKKDAPPRQGDVPPWYQPESGQPGTR